jgi:hypothetical protein
MRHPSEGVLRRLVDEPAGVTDDDRVHVASCPTCLRALESARADAQLVGSALTASGAADVDTDAAWARFSATPAPAAAPFRPAAAPRRGWRTTVRRPAVAALSAVVLLTGAGVAAANDWLPIFETERVEPVEITAGDLVQVPDLSAYGDLQITEEPDPEQVADADAARELTGLDVPTVTDLPDGVTGDPTYQAAGVVSGTFTFSADKAAQAEGEDLPPVPAGLDGSSLRLEAGPGVAAMWAQPTGVPTLVVARVGAPTVDASGGVTFGTVRDYLLSLPGLPPELAEQLGQWSEVGGTLPLPVPAELVTTSEADVNDEVATVLTSRNGLFAGVVWVEDGVMTGVAGSLSADELLSVARGLR